jgi:hypothetical protein
MIVGVIVEGKIRLTSDISLRLNMFQVVWFNELEPLLDTTFDISAALAHVAKQSPRQAKIRLCVCIDLEIHEVQDTLIMQGEDAFQDENVWRIHGRGLREPRMLLEGVYWDIDLLSLSGSAGCHDNGHLPSRTLI